MAGAVCNFHLPLSQDLHALLREEAERSGQPATSLAREALSQWLAQRRKQRLHNEISAFAGAEAGTDLDLDEGLEQAGLEAIEAERSA
jgi:predicted transcriptional regulator